MAQRLVREYRRPSLVLDPLGSSGWETEYVYTDSRAFVRAAAEATSCNLFVDESGEVIGQHEKEMFWLATRARHRGHLSHFIVQRPNQLSPTVRGQCSHLFIFRSGAKDSQILADEFACKEITRAASFRLGQYLYVTPDGTPYPGQLETRPEKNQQLRLVNGGRR